MRRELGRAGEEMWPHAFGSRRWITIGVEALQRPFSQQMRAFEHNLADPLSYFGRAIEATPRFMAQSVRSSR